MNGRERERTVSGPARDWLRLEEVADYLNVGLSTLKELVAAGDFPPGVRVSGRKAVRWGWLDCVAFMHLKSRNCGSFFPPDRAAEGRQGPGTAAGPKRGK